MKKREKIATIVVIALFLLGFMAWDYQVEQQQTSKKWATQEVRLGAQYQAAKAGEAERILDHEAWVKAWHKKRGLSTNPSSAAEVS